ncbi:Uncharacterised conserved protein (DUF2315) [Nesidiocoris tenuis]|uniref:Uncharacterized conserved protein (DUF2315) n=1 Tax=Nesidiocoris tenuis TaxID=355587 RepID=A0ABN7AX98_9HEMI|nr:Uncharacterised conserved protein (DUF2315) [Nesidiocoris tenuis]
MAGRSSKTTVGRGVYQLLKSWYPTGEKKVADHARRTSTAAVTITRTKDLVGPPDPLSNIRPITFYVSSSETCLEKKYRLRRQAVQTWHQNFWSKHNSAFVKERKEFEQSKQHQITSDEMSVFYKAFLDKYWLIHLKYAKQWYKHNFDLLGLAAQVQLTKMLKPLLK